jgi:hypothetical protein
MTIRNIAFMLGYSEFLTLFKFFGLGRGAMTADRAGQFLAG